jgi:O-antigen ligase
MQASSSAPISAGQPRPAKGRFSWALDADALDHFCERGILVLVALILAFGPLAFGAVGAPQAVVIQTLTAGVLVLWIARIWLGKPYRLLCAPICWAVALFAIYTVVRYRMVLGENGVEILARRELIQVLVYGFLFLAILNNLSRQESTQILSLTLLAVGALISLYAVYQFLTKSGRVLWTPQYPNYVGRASGTYVNPNHLAGFLEMILPLGLAYTLAGRFQPATKVFIGYATLCVFAGIGVSVSRGAWVAAGAGLLVFFGMLMRQRGQRLAAIVFCVLLVGAFTLFVKNLSVLQRRGGLDADGRIVDIVRLQLWKPAIRIWQDNLWWGAGPGHFDEAFRSYRPDDIQMRPLYTHNDYLNTLADYGLVGAVLVLAAVGLLYAGVFQSWKFVRRSNDLTTKRSNRSAFVLGAAAGLVSLLAHSAVDFNMHIPANAITAVALMALITGHLRFATERYWLKIGWLGKGFLTLICLAGGIYLGLQASIRAREYVLLRRAGQAKAFDEKIELLKAAHRVEPNNFETTYEIGESLRLASWEGRLDNYRALAEESIEWFERGAKLNRFDPYNGVKWGMSLHWLDRSQEAGPHFEQALKLDPKNYVIQGLVGWHYFQLGNWAESKRWFEQAVFQAHWHPEIRLKRYETGEIYLRLIEKKLAEQPRGQ